MYSQEENTISHLNERHGLSFLISHSYISQGKIDGTREWLAAPSFGINYNFKLNEKWSIGLHNDIIIESFVVEDTSKDEDLLEREYPISNLIVGTYKITESWGIAVGGGIEWERNENFGVIRIGTDYGLELNEKGLEVVFAINYDALIDAYDSINFGIGINKFFK
jgi:hypothetical protein